MALRDFNHLRAIETANTTSPARPAFLQWKTVLSAALIAFLLAAIGTLAVETLPLGTELVSASEPRATPVPQGGPSGPITARVVHITDGDTIIVHAADGKQMTVRLAEIDAPEWDQPWGAKSKAALSTLVSGRTVEIHPAGTDRYGRTLGRVYRSGIDVNAEMVRSGNAWAYREYLTGASLPAAEAEARSAKRGLWASPRRDITAPWDWRHGSKPSHAADRQQSSSFMRAASDSRQCLGKRYCRQMTSCEEARIYLHVCGVSSLDGDGDGVPCEALCSRRFN